MTPMKRIQAKTFSSRSTALDAREGAAASPRELSFPIVGVGASAGGLEALEQFLRGVPPDSGMAFVVIQHLDPTHQGLLPELLQRASGMTVYQVKDRMRVRPNCVYVIPPNRDMSILHGVLHLFEPAAPRGLRLPIDFFLRSLAEDRQQHSVGVILSGMGSDGTAGLRAIKEKAGLGLAQEPASAKFDSMPRSAIDAGLADLVAPAQELPGKIVEYLRHAQLIAKVEGAQEEKDRSSLEKVLILLRAKTGHDFSPYKKNTVYRRIERRMGIHQIDRLGSYVRYLQENPQELDLLFNELLIGVTNFFRDGTAWEFLRDEVLPALLAERQGGVLRVCSAGCSTGEEAYSLAIVFREALERSHAAEKFQLQIFATDLDRDAIDRARQGSYPANIAADVSSERLRRFFIKEENGYRVGKEIRGAVTFATQNLIMDPPFTKLDLLACRNLLIYLTPEVQRQLLPIFHYVLKPGGILFLGSAESLNSSGELFTPLNLKARLFQRRESALPLEPLAFPPALVPALSGVHKETIVAKPADNLQALADQLLLQSFSPSAVLVNGKGDILYISGRTGKYLEPAAGKANWNIFAMVRKGLRFELGAAFEKALRQKEAVTAPALKLGEGPGSQDVDIVVQAVQEPQALRGLVMVVFKDRPALENRKRRPRSGAISENCDRVQELERELQHLSEKLQVSREEMQSSQEELKSANEELQSTNEVLQSTNEELTTSREELQSLNEELQTVNAEQQSKMDELARTNNDMRNLLNSTEILTVFLDSRCRIRRYTKGVEKLFKLIPGDVGRPLDDIVNHLAYPELVADLDEVLRTLVFSEKQVATVDKRWFLVRIMPYRTIEEVIDGVVITFSNITAAKRLEAELREENARLVKRLETGN